MKVLAISAWKRSGKDSMCDRLAGRRGVRVSFADPLKDRVAEEYGIRRADLDEQDKKEKPILHLPVDPQDAFTRTIANLMVREFRTANGQIATVFDSKTNKGSFWNHEDDCPADQTLYWTPRALAIFKGSGNRAVASNYWVQQAINKIEDAFKRNSDLVVIPDLRFKSEMVQLREAFGEKLVTVRINRFDESPSTDASERDLDNADFDHFIENRGTLEEFYAKIDHFVEEFKI